MRHLLLLAFVSVGCSTSSPGSSSGDDMGPDGTCPLPMTTADTGAMAAVQTQMCNYPMSGGQQHWYRAFAPLPGSAMSVVQVELYDKLGAFGTGAVKMGMFPVDPNPASCGICVRGMGDKGGTDAKEYFATSGMVNITSIGANGGTLTVALSNLGFVELDANRKPVTGGCTAAVTAGQLSGTIVQMGGTGGGGGGGGGGGMCPQTIGN